MGVNDLMILDLETLQNIRTREPGVESPDPTDPTDTSISLQTETVPDLDPAAAKPTAPRKKRQFTLREETPAGKRHDPHSIPTARYGGAGVYSMPVRYSGNGKFERGRDHPRYKEPEYSSVMIETSDFELENVERDIRRRRRRRLDDES